MEPVKSYSYKVGVAKAALQLLTVIGALVAFMGFNEIPVWELVETYIRPFVGSLTVGGLIAFAINYIKFNYFS